MTPPVQLETDVAALPEGIAFDEEGGLWFAYSAGRIARFAPSQLVGQGPATPATIITNSDIGGGNAGWFAFYPAPAFTPLAHALPERRCRSSVSFKLLSRRETARC